MAVHLGTLYHWSPKRNRRSILRSGLEIMHEMVDAEELREDFPELAAAAMPWVCLGTTPATAWGLVPDCEAKKEAVWDLWEVRLDEGDRVTIRGYFAPHIHEVRVHHGLPADRVWWVGEREFAPHMTL